MTTLVSLTTAARATYNAMQIQHEQSKNSTQQWYDAITALREKGADYLKAIKAYAATTNNPNVFTLAVIPPPKSPTPTPPPSTPTSLTATLLNNGAIKLDWKASVAKGTAFSVWRKLAGQPSFEQIGLASSDATFTDDTLPVGGGGGGGPDSQGGVWYQTRAHRLGQSSEFSEPIFVRFGNVAGGSESEGGDLKIAA